VIWSLAETGMGIIPGTGGVVRATRQLGIAATVLEVVGSGAVFHPAQALAAGLVDELADDVVAAARRWVLAQPQGRFLQRWERPGYEIPGGADAPPGLAEQVRIRSAGSPVRALEAVLDVAVRSASLPIEDAFEVETAAFRTLLTAPEVPALSHLFFALRTLAGVSEPTGSGTAAVREFPQITAHPLAAVFFAPDAPVVEVVGDAPGDAVAEIRAKGGMPVVIRRGSASFVQTLLDAGPDPGAMAVAARRLLDEGLVIDPAGADVASVVAAGFPAWTGGVHHFLSST
jgi:3-hydroxyacyl-CoA dehydrogenase/enoyl-CoA hydratase/3-hydroxybutyryl-CoA epimerase